MKLAGYTLQERRLLMLLRWWVGLFAAASVAFAIFPTEIVSTLNTVGHAVFNWPWPSIPASKDYFWPVMAVSLLVILTIIAYMAQNDIRQNLNLVPIIIMSKVVTTAGFLIAFLFAGRHFVYFVGAIVDGIIFILTWFCYYRAVVSRGL